MVNVRDVYVNSVAINDFYDSERFFVIFFKVVSSCLFFGYGLLEPPAFERAVVKPDKNKSSQQAQKNMAERLRLLIA